MAVVFWASLFLVVYVYAGYPVLLWIAARLWNKPLRSSEIYPTVTLIVPAYNDECWIGQKLQNALHLEYPHERLQILVACDGCSDATVEIASTYEARGVEVMSCPVRLGKEEALNRALLNARGDIVVVSDAGALLESDALRFLVRHFADPQVGGVSGARRCVHQR